MNDTYQYDGQKFFRRLQILTATLHYLTLSSRCINEIYRLIFKLFRNGLLKTTAM